MSKYVLICDDEVHILRAVEIKLKRAGYEVACAADGEEAWQLIEQRTPDVVVTDCQMPRLDGLGLAARIHDNPLTRDIPVIMLSGKGYELLQIEAPQKYNLRAIVGKPFSPRELFRQVEIALGVISPLAAGASKSTLATNWV